MTNEIEKVIESFKARKKSCEYKLKQLPFEGKQPKHITDKYKKLIEFYTIAIQVCEKQVSKRIRHPIDKNGNPNYIVTYCYMCGTNVHDQLFCHHCGQLLDWKE